MKTLRKASEPVQILLECFLEVCWESVWELVWLFYPGAQVSSLIEAALGVRMPWSTLAVGWSLC